MEQATAVLSQVLGGLLTGLAADMAQSSSAPVQRPPSGPQVARATPDPNQAALERERRQREAARREQARQKEIADLLKAIRWHEQEIVRLDEVIRCSEEGLRKNKG